MLHGTFWWKFCWSKMMLLLPAIPRRPNHLQAHFQLLLCSLEFCRFRIFHKPDGNQWYQWNINANCFCSINRPICLQTKNMAFPPQLSQWKLQSAVLKKGCSKQQNQTMLHFWMARVDKSWDCPTENSVTIGETKKKRKTEVQLKTSMIQKQDETSGLK